MSAIVTLTTDFGLSDAYVAAMKGVILGINPGVRLVDICHTVKPRNIARAAFILGTAYPFFPGGTVHLVVVDPGVGSKRRSVILKTSSAFFVAPDNGVLSYIVEQSSPGSDMGDTDSLPERQLGSGLEAIAITRSQFWRSPVSPTFHGRDIFAPVAAHLSLGQPPSDFGEPITSLKTLTIARPQRKPDGSLVGNILHSDTFGNLVTSIRCRDVLPVTGTLVTEVGGRIISGLVNTYAEGEGLMALLGSSGYLEVSLRDGSARDLLGADVGDEVRISLTETKYD
jgi:S-adenosylmethionine hydrolase